MWQVLAALLSPLLAIQVNTWLTDRKERRRRKQVVFQTLWLTRGDLGWQGRLSPEHVRALNTIEIEFVKRKADDFFGDDSSERVLEAWAAYRAALFTPRPFVGDPPDPNDQAAAERWDATTNDLLVELLYVMARAVGYDFDRDFIRSAYAPLGHFNNEIEAMTMRGALGKVLRGETALRITSEAPPTPTVAQPALDGLTLHQPVLSAPDVDDPKK